MQLDQASTDRIIQFRVLLIASAFFFLGAFSLRAFASRLTQQKFMPKRIPESLFSFQRTLLVLMGVGALVFALITWFKR